MKKIIEYVLIFITVIIALFLMLVVSSKIPRSAIKDNLIESLDFYKEHPGIERGKNKYIYTYIHYYADTRKLNIIYCMDTDNVLESVLWARYYQKVKMDTNKDFINAVENNLKPNTEYVRYWHGVILFLRVLLVVFNMPQIYLINKILIYSLLLLLIMILFKKSKKLSVAFLITLILTAIWYVPKTIEYSVTFYIFIITTLIVLKIDNKKTEIKNVDSKLFKLFFVTGIVTTFFDFLTTEILTLFIPLIVVLLIRYEAKRVTSMKELIIFIIKACFVWLIGYACTWIAKWLLASLVLNINAMDYVKENLMLRINGVPRESTHGVLFKTALNRNIFNIPVLAYVKIKYYKWQVKLAVWGTVLLVLIFINWKEIKNKKYIVPMLLISMAPYARYFVLAQHSRNHVMFTFRSQIITLTIILYIIIDCLNYKLLFKDIKLKRKNN